MPIYEVEFGGTKFEVDAPNLARAESAARLMVARKQSIRQAEEGATARTALTPAEQMRTNSERLKTIDPEQEREMTALIRSKEPGAAGAALGLTASIPLVGGMVTAPVATGLATLGGLAGSALGKEGGEWVGRRVPVVGGETAANVLGTVGGVVGGGVGAVAGPKLGARGLANVVTGGRFGGLLPEAEKKASAAGLSKATEQRLANEAERLALKKKAVDIAERRLLLAEKKAAATAEKAVAEAGGSSAPTPAKPPIAPVTSPEADAEIQTIVLKLQQRMGTADGRRMVRELLNDMPREQASQIRLLLARGQAHPATVGGRTGVTSATPTRLTDRAIELSSELAKMLGQ